MSNQKINLTTAKEFSQGTNSITTTDQHLFEVEGGEQGDQDQEAEFDGQGVHDH